MRTSYQGTGPRRGRAAGTDPVTPREMTRQPGRQEAVGNHTEIEIRQNDRAVWVTLSGILDRAGIDRLIARVAPRLERRGCRIVLDGSRLTHLDYRATGALIAWNRRLARVPPPTLSARLERLPEGDRGHGRLGSRVGSHADGHVRLAPAGRSALRRHAMIAAPHVPVLQGGDPRICSQPGRAVASSTALSVSGGTRPDCSRPARRFWGWTWTTSRRRPAANWPRASPGCTATTVHSATWPAALRGAGWEPRRRRPAGPGRQFAPAGRPGQGLQLPRRRSAGSALRPDLRPHRSRPAGRAGRSGDRRPALALGRGTGQPPYRARTGPAAQRTAADDHHAGARSRAGLPAARGQARAGAQPGLPGAAHRGQRRTGRARGRAGFAASACCGRVDAWSSSPTTRWKTVWSSGSSTANGATACARRTRRSASAVTGPGCVR